MKMFEDLPICRICLRTDRSLGEVDEALSDFHDDQSQYVIFSIGSKYCWECEHLLRKWYNFKEKCLRSVIILQKWIKNKNSNKMSIHSLQKSLPPSPLGLCFGRNTKIYEVTYCKQELDPLSLTTDIVDCNATIKLETEPMTSINMFNEELLIKQECIDMPVETLGPLLYTNKSKDLVSNTKVPDDIPLSKVKLLTGNTKIISKPSIKRNMPINEIVYKRRRPPGDLDLNKQNDKQVLKPKTIEPLFAKELASKSDTAKKKLQIVLKKKKPIRKPVLKIKTGKTPVEAKGASEIRDKSVLPEAKKHIEAPVFGASEISDKSVLPEAKKRTEVPVLKVIVPFVEPVARGMLTVGPIVSRIKPDLEPTVDMNEEKNSLTPSEEIRPIIIKTESLIEEILPD